MLALSPPLAPRDAETAANATERSRTSASVMSAPAKTAPAAEAPQADVELQRREAVKAMEDGGVLTMYLQSGKKKHDRYFWLENGKTICWDKKRTKPGKSNKSGALVSFEPAPATKTARQWFDFFDEDHSGELDAEELAQLYRSARGEKLKKKEVCLRARCGSQSAITQLASACSCIYDVCVPHAAYSSSRQWTQWTRMAMVLSTLKNSKAGGVLMVATWSLRGISQ